MQFGFGKDRSVQSLQVPHKGTYGSNLFTSGSIYTAKSKVSGTSKAVEFCINNKYLHRKQ